MNETSGPTSPTPFAYYDRATSSWKTSQLTLAWDSGEYSETWPKRGTMRNGECFVRPMLGFPTNANESLLLPTVTAHPDSKSPEAYMAMKARMGRRTASDLRVALQLLPTPQARDYKGASGGTQFDLTSEVTKQQSRDGNESADARLLLPSKGRS